jgi:hypothetical protein
MDSTNSPQIDLFFQDPKHLNKEQQSHSTLFLLRRDIYTCLGKNPNDLTKIGFSAIFPGAMAIMAGIDLLAKLRYTDNDIVGNRSGDRFKKFVDEYIDEHNKEVLYQLRNSLLHSFGLYSKDNNGKEYYFRLNKDDGCFVKHKSDTIYQISISLLHKKFEDAIEKYKADLISKADLLPNFQSIYDRYGVISIR